MRVARSQGRAEHLRQRAGDSVGQGHGHQGAHVLFQCGHIAPNAQHLCHQGCAHGVELLTPVVLHRFKAQPGFVAHQVFFKQAAAVERVSAQHALAPGVDGVHGRVVHRLRRQRQAMRGLLAQLAFGVFVLQLFQEVVVGFCNVPEHLRGLSQPSADAVRQLACGGAGEGHDQHVLRQHGAHRCGALLAVAQHQAHIERGNRPGLARASARLDQVAATQGEGGCMEIV